MRRVVVTGVGMVSPLGVGVRESWTRIVNGESGVKQIISFDASDLSSKIAGQLPAENVHQKASRLFDPLEFVTAKDINRMDKFIVYALAAATEAVNDSGVDGFSDEDKISTGVMIGSGIGGLATIAQTAVTLENKGPRFVSPFFIPSSLINLASGYVSIRFGLKGPNHSVVTACASGSHAIGDACRIIQNGAANVMLAGGAEAAICRLGVAGFAAARALSTKRNDTPEEASRPWDKSRDGFVMGEGAGVLVLEELEHARKRGAEIYAEIVGYGLSGDAHHITAPCPDGDGAYRAMKMALDTACINSSDVDYVNAHGTSTPAGDVGELRAVERVMDGHKAMMSSTKSAIGHLLGAAGAVEAIFSVLAIRDKVAPPTLNLHDSEETFLNLVPLVSQQKNITCAMSNSFGFGGTNASLVFKRL